MRFLLQATCFAIACALPAAEQSGRIKRAEPTASPAPEQQAGQRDAGRLGDARAAIGSAAAHDDAEPERDKTGNRVYLDRQVDRKAQLLSRPEPAYPRRARRGAVQGTVRLRAVLAASGKVEKIAVLKGLPEGVTEEAIKAARLIKFAPAERDGRRVSQSVVIEYNFNLY